MKNLIKYLSLSTALCLISLFSASLNAQIPEPYLYYNFEEALGSPTVTDSSGNDREGTVSGNVEFGAEGAPSGSTPAGAGQFSVGGTGYVTVGGSDAPTDFGNRDQGILASYTMACWIKPDQGSFSGDRFIFGQGNQGIHHGFRGGNLYHAHWGSDFSGQSALSPDEWAHTTFTYDSETSRGVIYVNGEFDTEMNGQQGPNGGGPLIIGARNGGGENYVGLIDDLAVWQEVLPEESIEALAEGVSPIGAGGAGATYSQNFDEYDDGTTDLDDGSVMTGAAASVQDGRLQLTIDQQGLGFSSFSVPELPGSAQGFTVSFDYELYDSPGANDPADGFSFNYGDAPLGDQGQAEEGMATRPGVTENISFEVDTWQNGDAEQGVNISGLAGGVDLGQLAFTNGIVLEDDSRKTGTIEISWNPALGASFTTTGLTTNADFSEVDTGAFVADDEYNFIISARVGGANEDLFIDNLVITVDSTDDSDRDGLPDYWEEKIVDNLDDLNGNGAGPGPGSGTGDFDGDGLTDLDEYEETRTDPTKADTDEDGLSDGVETNTGTYVSATNTGTNPKKADSDKDGLLDGVETNTGTLVDEDDTGTDPNNSDTDGDGYTDGGEIAGGTDPHDPNSKGAMPFPFLYVDFEDNASDLSGNDYHGEVDGAVSFDVEGAEGGPTPTTGGNFTGGHLDFFDIDMNSMINTFEDGSYTFSCWMKPIGSAGGDGFMWGQTNQGIHNGIRNGGFLHSAHWGADWNASTVLEAEQWVHAAWVYDGAADTATIYLNGQIDGGPQAQRAPNGGGTFIFGGRNNGEIAYNGYVDDVAIWREVLPEGTIQALADGMSPIGATQEDEDGDGLPDSWEEKYGVDDPEGDDDNDGLTNVEEYELRTKPNKADSDEDGLSDKDEIEVHKTNPLNPDADRDGLLDGEEIAAGTDPDDRDTDGDGISDFNEIRDGTDPLVVTAIAFETNLVSYWPLDSDFDDAKDENHGVEEGGPIEFQTGKFDGAIYLNGSQSIVISGDENTFDFAGESFTVSAWYTAEAINKSWQCLVAKGEGNGWRVHRRGGDNPPEMTFTGGNGDVDRHNVAMTVGGDPETWHHVAGVTDSSTQEEILYLDGEEVARKAGATLQDRGNPMRIGDNPDALNRNWQGKVDDLAIWGRALSPIEIEEIWDGGSGKSIEEMLGLSVPFDFTSVIYDAQEDSFRFEWNSKPNRTYALYFSETLEEFDADIDDSIESGGESTVYPPIGEPGLENPLEGVRKLFFRIEENQ